MSEYKKIKISDYSYILPDDRIAKYPLKDRASSKLLIWKYGTIYNDRFRNITNYLPDNTMLVFNNTRVIHARMFFYRETGAKIEIFCLKPALNEDYQMAFQRTGSCVWECMTGNAKRWKDEVLQKKLMVNGRQVLLSARKAGKSADTFLIKFQWNPGYSFAEIINSAGTLPIPPYLNRETEPDDEMTYQTIYAKSDGSVAAPTAGLHFTDQLLNELRAHNIGIGEITLHVGAGTFKPVKSEAIGGHEMHDEEVVISRVFIEKVLSDTRKRIAVGTTSVRSLESLYWIGLKLNSQELSPENLTVGQWEPYELYANIDVETALNNILSFLDHHQFNSLRFTTQIIIIPGYSFKITDGIVTNFHQPQSTLLLLISAFIGEDWKKIYHYALNNNYRFLSYGDSNLYLKNE